MKHWFNKNTYTEDGVTAKSTKGYQMAAARSVWKGIAKWKSKRVKYEDHDYKLVIHNDDQDLWRIVHFIGSIETHFGKTLDAISIEDAIDKYLRVSIYKGKYLILYKNCTYYGYKLESNEIRLRVA
jgi:hypothetical protein